MNIGTCYLRVMLRFRVELGVHLVAEYMLMYVF